MNIVKTAMLLAALTALFGVVGYLLGGGGGMTHRPRPRRRHEPLRLLELRPARAQRARRRRGRRAHRAGARRAWSATLSRRAGLPMPRVYLIDNPQPNAFATGRNPQNAAVAATTGLLQILSPRRDRRRHRARARPHQEPRHADHDHERHHRGRDLDPRPVRLPLRRPRTASGRTRSSCSPRRSSRPLAAMVIQMAISRSREYDADRDGAEISGQPLALASALAKIAGAAQHIPNPDAERHPATAPLFIINPLSGHGMDNLFSTHPATENRIAAPAGARPRDRPAAPRRRGRASAIRDRRQGRVSAAARGRGPGASRGAVRRRAGSAPAASPGSAWPRS